MTFEYLTTKAVGNLESGFNVITCHPDDRMDNGQSVGRIFRRYKNMPFLFSAVTDDTLFYGTGVLRGVAALIDSINHFVEKGKVPYDSVKVY